MTKFKKVFNLNILAVLSALFLFNTTLYPSPIYDTLLRIPINNYGRMKDIFDFKQNVADILQSDEPFDVLIETGKIPYPMRTEGLNHTSFISEIIKQAVNKINNEGKAQIKKITTIKFNSLVNNRWMLGSDIDGTIIYSSEPVPDKTKQWFCSVLERCGALTFEKTLERNIEWKLISEENPPDAATAVIYENGEMLKAQDIYIPERGKSTFRDRLLKLWSANALTKEEKALLADLHMASVKNILSGRFDRFAVSDKQLETLKNIAEKDLLYFITDKAIVLEWISLGGNQGMLILDVQKIGRDKNIDSSL